MAAGASFIDLHTHSVASDGEHRPAEVASRVAAAGTQVWSLTDHDTVAGQAEGAQAAKRLGIRFVPGIELSVYLGQREIHVLGHFVDPGHAALRRFEDVLAERRRVRMGEMVTRLAALGIAIREDDIVKWSGGKTIGRPHVARALVEAGAAATVKEAFDRYLGEGRPAYVPRFRLEAEESIRFVREAGGVATVAHPGNSGIERGDLSRLRQAGLGGVEVGHPDHNPSVRDKYRKLCQELDLVPTAGTDYHGEAVSPGRSLGSARMAAEDLERLEARRP
ncbi:MAG TPA: PHP domain-containing protein [Anaeromyxobacteraceae bacterium]|nr:PHP domain-containing protein [Anaeromyxobacteraceae bacterium]